MFFMPSFLQETLGGISTSSLCKSTFTLGVIVGDDCVAATFQPVLGRAVSITAVHSAGNTKDSSTNPVISMELQ